ncbi:unnamed protein product [Symbiodinium sp. CCMP2592]|nr:unnamed protein product [Symbiodinium sp. CCMP2592]
MLAAPPAAPAAPSFSWEIGFDRIVLERSVGQGVTAHVYEAILDGRYQEVTSIRPAFGISQQHGRALQKLILICLLLVDMLSCVCCQLDDLE